MLLELVDSLRCLGDHESTWLVARIDRRAGAGGGAGASILEGSLGCPLCGRRYPVLEGAADFREPGARSAPEAEAEAAPEVEDVPVPEVEAGSASEVEDVSVPEVEARSAPSDEEIFRVRAQLDLTEGGGVIALLGGASRFAAALVREAGIRVLLINPAPTPSRHEVWSVLLVDEKLPLAPSFLRGVVVGAEEGARTVSLQSLADALRPGGRLVAPRGRQAPSALQVLAHDEREWVAARNAATASAPVGISARTRNG